MLLRTWRRVVPHWGQVSATVQQLHVSRCPHAPAGWLEATQASVAMRCSSSSSSSSEPSAVVAVPTPAPPKPPAKAHKLRPITKGKHARSQFTSSQMTDGSHGRLSSGAGGQNVNKVNTKVDMRFDIDKQTWIPEEIKEEVKRAEKNRFTKEGILVVTSQKHRTQLQNIDEALNRLQEILDAAVVALTPKEINPETVKKVKASIKAGHEKRLDTKKKDSMKKKERSRKDWD